MAVHADTTGKLTALTGWIRRRRKAQVSVDEADPADCDISERVDTHRSQAVPTQTTSSDGIEPSDDDVTAPWRGSGVRLATVLGLITLAVLGALSSGLGYQAYQGHRGEQQRSMFLEAARHGAVNLTTINYAEADADVRRILDAATGTFHEDFDKSSKPFIEVVRQAQAVSQGTVTEAGFESDSDDQAQVLVGVAVKTSAAGSPEQPPQQWRMRITVQKVGDGAKISDVEFVP